MQMYTWQVRAQDLTGSFPPSPTAQWLGRCICRVLDLMGLAARWLSVKYSKEGKGYFTSLAREGCTFVKAFLK